MVKKTYFSILDPLRFIASICVLLAHSVVFFQPDSANNIQFPAMIRNAGYYGVIFFYVLSGFLITYLLLVENENRGTIDVRKFYIRRMLRIWPLYYLIILLSFFVFRYSWPWKELWIGYPSYTPKLLLYLIFLPNIAVWVGPVISTCFQTNTIGYEEQFYLLWPWVVRWVKKYMKGLLVLLYFGFILLDIVHGIIIDHTYGQEGWTLKVLKGALTLIQASNFPGFIAGAFVAVVYLKSGDGILRYFRWRGWAYVLVAAIFCILYATRPEDRGIVNIISAIYAVLILHLIMQPERTGRWRGILSAGGKISYGIYMFHPAVLIFIATCGKKAGMPGTWPAYVLYLIVSLVLVLAVAKASYRWFERPFLKRKDKFETRYC